jgi:hypothetical protein
LDTINVGIFNDMLPDAYYRDSCQWRIFIMAHMLTDLRVESAESLNGGYASIAYNLGNSVHTMPFKYEIDSSSAHSLIWVRQCKLHYVCGTVKDAKELFAEKLTELLVYYSPANQYSTKEVR